MYIVFLYETIEPGEVIWEKSAFLEDAMGKTLICYFSASEWRVTEIVARKMAEATGADLFEIVPEVPYTKGDIRWTNPLARCTKERFGNLPVPYKGKIENISDYDLILLGFPIWYGGAPNIVLTFISEQDTSGKKIGAFATSGGTGVGRVFKKIEPCLSSSAKIVGAKLFKGNSAPEELAAWVESL